MGPNVSVQLGSCIRERAVVVGVDVDEYEGPQERASRVARQGEMKQKFNLSKFVSIIALRKPSGEKGKVFMTVSFLCDHT